MVFFQRFWVGRHARYPNERVEALKKWNFHNMAPLKDSGAKDFKRGDGKKEEA